MSHVKMELYECPGCGRQVKGRPKAGRVRCFSCGREWYPDAEDRDDEARHLQRLDSDPGYDIDCRGW